MEWLKTVQEISQAGSTVLLVIIVYVQWKQNERLFNALIGAKDETGKVKGEAAREMIGFLRDAREAGLVPSSRSKTPNGTKIQT